MGKMILALLLAGSVWAAEPLCPEACGWKPVAMLSDEFDGTRLDAAKWDDWVRSFPGRTAAGAVGSECKDGFMFAPENVSVANGELLLSARMLAPAEQTRRNDFLRHAPYATSIVRSRGRICYGYFEIRAKPMKACVSNAFWLYDPHSDDPATKFRPGDVSEEIDIFEVTGRPDSQGKQSDCSKTYYNTLHFYCTPYLEAVVNRQKWNPPQRSFKTKLEVNLSDDYHVYGFLWTPERLVWYLDGRPTAERVNDGLFHRPLHVTFDSEVFTTWFGTPDPRDLPAQFHIDYVRVWECPPPRNSALVPRMKIQRDSYDWFARHARAVEHARELQPEIVFLGDSITHFWAGRDSLGGEDALPRWKRSFGKWRTLNLGYGWDRTGNLLWRIGHGELDGIDPRVVVVHIGGNNFTTTKYYAGNTAEETAEGVLAVMDAVRAKLPRAKLVVMGIFPFGEFPSAPHRVKAQQANAILAREVAKRDHAVFIDLTKQLVGPDGRYSRSMARDFVHPTDKGYEVWASALTPQF